MMLFILKIICLIAFLSSCLSGNRFDTARSSLLRLIFSSLAKLSRNSSHSSIMSRSVFGFRPIAISILYFAELKINTSDFA